MRALTKRPARTWGVLAASAALLSYAAFALADTVTIDGDNATTGIQSPLEITAEPGELVTYTASLRVNRQGSKHLKSGTSVTFANNPAKTNLPAGYTVATTSAATVPNGPSLVSPPGPDDWDDNSDTFAAGTSQISFTVPNTLSDGDTEEYDVKWLPQGTCDDNKPATDCVNEPALKINVTVEEAAPPAKSDQTITFPADPGYTYGDAPFDPGATATSGLAVSYSSDTPLVCAVNGSNLVVILAAGDCTITGSQAGDDDWNPAPNQQQTYDIDPLGITATITAANKIYDGDDSAEVTGGTLSGVINPDVVNLVVPDPSTATFDNKNVGTGKAVSPGPLSGYSLGGADAGNYTLTAVNGTTADITALGITGTISASDKVYDNTTVAAVTGGTLSGVISPDVVNLVVPDPSTATFDTEHVGTGKTVSPGPLSGYSLDGADAGNYELTAVNGTTADITARPIEVTASDASKVVGALDPTPFGYTITDGSLAVGDTFTGALDREDGETIIGSPFYAITQGTLAIDDGNGGNNYDLTFVEGTFRITFAPASACGKTIMQPINAVAPFSSFKLKSTVPAKFTVCDANRQPIYVPGTVVSVERTSTAGATGPIVNELLDSTNSTAGFRWSDDKWIWNIPTKSLSALTYMYKVNLIDGDTVEFQFTLK